MKQISANAFSFCLKMVLFVSFLLPKTSNAQEAMRANLYTLANDGSTHLMDGNLTNYNNIYSNLIDQYDALKLENPGANFGIFRLNTNLAIERRQALPATDTTVFKMWNMTMQNYRLKLILTNLNNPNTWGYLYDSYTQLEVPIGLNDTTYYDFTVNSDAGSYNLLRFKLVYAPIPLRIYMPVIWEASFDNPWSAGLYSNLYKTILEQSGDGINYKPIRPNNLVIDGENGPVWYNRGAGTQYFRASTNKRKDALSNQIEKENHTNGVRSMVVYPNPVNADGFNLRLNNQPAGKYMLSLISANGRRYLLQGLTIGDKYTNTRVQLPQTLVPGIYQLQVIAPDKEQSVISLNIR